ncbi:hypothetical protein LHT10_10130 [Lactococcus lactis]|uniref:hypothetical protein n=1 Tax=Lactococcus lactis TaxID=1358 RepID=UPI001F2932DB|nr:hypothetical protein [Lactococcus lactis]MCG1001493.1 hypothetical protein [Lactococcus lactis]
MTQNPKTHEIIFIHKNNEIFTEELTEKDAQFIATRPILRDYILTGKNYPNEVLKKATKYKKTNYLKSPIAILRILFKAKIVDGYDEGFVIYIDDLIAIKIVKNGD